MDVKSVYINLVVRSEVLRRESNRGTCFYEFVELLFFQPLAFLRLPKSGFLVCGETVFIQRFTQLTPPPSPCALIIPHLTPSLALPSPYLHNFRSFLPTLLLTALLSEFIFATTRIWSFVFTKFSYLFISYSFAIYSTRRCFIASITFK